MHTSKTRCRLPVSAYIANRNFACGAVMKRSIAPTLVISQTVSGQVSVVSEFERILAYQSAMAQARAMMKTGIIEEEELIKIETLMAKKYGFDFRDLLRDIDLIMLGSRGNMPYYEGGV